MIPSRLHNSGLAISNVRDFYEPADWNDLRAEVSAWQDSPEFKAEVEKFHAGTREGFGKKHFAIKFNAKREYAADSPIMRLARSAKVYDTIEKAEGPVKLICADLWHTPGNATKWEPELSQGWHRDGDDSMEIKVFAYLDDVNDEAGPFEYVLGSHCAWFDLCPPGVYPGDVDFEAVWPQLYVKVEGEAGTMFFCNTTGLHKGGYCKSKGRTIVVFTYMGEASQHPNLYTVK